MNSTAVSNNDPFGAAIHDFFEQGKAPDIAVNTNYTEDEIIPVSYLFRKENEMPGLEKMALKLCKGTVLDIGAAAGCHALVLQEKGLDVTALDNSALAVEVMKKRGVKQVLNADIYEFSERKFDTLLLLMNGTGIGGTISGLKKLLVHLKSLLNPNGQVLIDSSDIKYLFEEEDGSMWIDLNNSNYYGEMQYELSYKNHKTTFDWLFIDSKKLQKLATEAGFRFELVKKGEHFDYLAQLTII
ncbi:class I SAM-dependent methyltransferase [Maribellus sediminis]|uniref:class I SAM-dependent methyltransferase n=1 Tax=Maribellus sediminis TaxID=2696285 RepID=UPI001431B58A|nr:class I SAM-dependent methyltransferase [Maribellus sediminis]